MEAANNKKKRAHRVGSSAVGSFEVLLLGQIAECGGFAVCFAMLRVSKEVRAAVQERMRENSALQLPRSLVALMSEDSATQGIIATTLHVSEEAVKKEYYAVRRRRGGGEYHVFGVDTAVRRLFRAHGGLAGLQRRIDEKNFKAWKAAQKKRQAEATRVKNNVPPKERRDEWISKTEAKKLYAHLTKAQLAGTEESLPLVPTPGSTSQNPRKGFWRKDCRRAERFAVMEARKSVSAGVRHTALTVAGPGKDFRLPYDTVDASHSAPLSEEDLAATERAADAWRVTAAVACALPAPFRAKQSVLQFATQYLGDSKLVERRQQIDAINKNTDDKKRAAFVFLKRVVDARGKTVEALRLLTSRTFLESTFYEFLQPQDAVALAGALPDVWNVTQSVRSLAEAARVAAEDACLYQIGESRADLDALTSEARRNCARRLLTRAAFVYRGVEPDTVRGGFTLAEVLENLRSLIADDATTRRDRLREALRQRGLSLRSDSSFCTNYVQGATDASLAEVVATMRLTSHLFSFGHRCWSHNHDDAEDFMRSQARACRDWNLAYDRTLSASVIHHDYYDSDDYYASDDDSYGGCGYRRRGRRRDYWW